MLKKIYIEITNRCNLNCSFCIKNKRSYKDMTKDEYMYIIDKIKGKSKEVYLHVLGEPLIHKDINYFIDYASSQGLLVNITTNGYLIDRIKDNKNIHRLNISLHSYNKKYGISLEDYLNKIFMVIDNIRNRTFIALRLWVSGSDTTNIVNYINKRYNTNINELCDNKKIKISNNLIIDTFHEFIWPSIDNNYYMEEGTCLAIRDHIGILSDGRIVPCCLDSEGIINLGNIYTDSIDEVINSKRAREMVSGFRNNIKKEELCKHCKFLDNK